MHSFVYHGKNECQFNYIQHKMGRTKVMMDLMKNINMCFSIEDDEDHDFNNTVEFYFWRNEKCLFSLQQPS